MTDETTIAAIATPPGTGAIAVVRMSGPQAHEIAVACCGRRLEPRRATLVRLRRQDGSVVDEAVATYFAAPASYTGEDVVEISCHGGMLVTRRVLECLLAAGACPAEPGEFSRRAFTHGKLDLTRAEAVMDIISAGSDLALRAAQNQLQGAISSRVEAAADQLISTAAHLGAYIDFPEEEISPDTMEQLAAAMQSVRRDLQQLLDTADEGRFLREGVRTAIIGAPNVGKSSLLNMLLGYERAIVSNVAGTTRDTIEESVSLAGLRLRLTDTAGLHESADAIECAGMERSRRAGVKGKAVPGRRLLGKQFQGDLFRKKLHISSADGALHPSGGVQEHLRSLAPGRRAGIGKDAHQHQIVLLFQLIKHFRKKVSHVPHPFPMEFAISPSN